MFMKDYAPNRCEPSTEALNFGGRGGVIRADVNCEHRSEVFVKLQKKLGGAGVWSGWGGQGRCEQRDEDFEKIQKIYFFLLGGSGYPGVGLGGQGRCEQKSEFFAKIQKKFFGGVRSRGSEWI